MGLKQKFLKAWKYTVTHDRRKGFLKVWVPSWRAFLFFSFSFLEHLPKGSVCLSDVFDELIAVYSLATKHYHRDSVKEFINCSMAALIRSQSHDIRLTCTSIKVLLWSNSRYPFFYIFVHNRSFLDILVNFKLLRTLQRAFFGPLFPII